MEGREALVYSIVSKSESLSGSFQKLGGTLIWGSYNEDPTI